MSTATTRANGRCRLGRRAGQRRLRRAGRLGAARVNFTVIAATTPANNAADLAALEDMAVLVLNRLTVTEPIASPTYTDLGSIEAATIYIPVQAHVTLDRE